MDSWVHTRSVSRLAPTRLSVLFPVELWSPAVLEYLELSCCVICSLSSSGVLEVWRSGVGVLLFFSGYGALAFVRDSFIALLMELRRSLVSGHSFHFFYPGALLLPVAPSTSVVLLPSLLLFPDTPSVRTPVLGRSFCFLYSTVSRGKARRTKRGHLPGSLGRCLCGGTHTLLRAFSWPSSRLNGPSPSIPF